MVCQTEIRGLFFQACCTPKEGKFCCCHGLGIGLGDVETYVVLSDQWSVFCKRIVKYVIDIVVLTNER